MTQPERPNSGRDPFARDPALPRNDEPPARYPERGSADDADWTPPAPPDLLGRGAGGALPPSPPRPAPPPLEERPPQPSARPANYPLRGLSPVDEAEVRGITGTQPHRGVLLLVVALAAFFVCQLLFPVVWMLAHGDLAEMRSGRMDPDGRGLTQAALIIGIVGTVLMLVPLALMLVFAVFAGGLTFI